MKLRFYQCSVCGKLITVLSGPDIPTECCGGEMRELIPNRADASLEKHVPVVTVSGNTVTVRVGSAPHPMLESHSIKWIGLETGRGFRFKELKPGEEPAAVFLLDPGESAGAVYAFCDLHGLWCTEKEGEA